MKPYASGQTTWSTGTCKSLVGPRSYDVQVGERVYRRNRRQLIYANEPPLTDPPIVDLLPSEQLPPTNETLKSSQNSDVEITSSQMEFHPCKTNVESKPALPVTESQFRRSGRITKTPKWMEDYVPS